VYETLKLPYTPILLNKAIYFSAHKNLKLGNLSLSRSKQAQASLNSTSRIEVTLHTAFEQHPTAQMNDHDSCNSANEHVLEGPNVWSVDGDVERDI
jgi:hypothetical protein